MLKLIVASLDEVDEKFRELYAEKKGADGKSTFELKVEGAKSQADIDRLQAALNKERTDHTAAKASLKTATDKLAAFGDIDPDDVAAKLEKLTTLEAAGANPKAEEITRLVNAGVESKLKTETTKLNRTIATLTTERDEALKQATDLNGQIINRQLDDAIRSAAVTAKVIPEAIADVLIMARGDFKLVDGKAVTEDGRDPTQWVEDSKRVRPWLWPAAKGAGGNPGGDNPGGENPFSAKQWNITKQGQMVQADPSKADRLAKEAGTTVGGPRPKAA